MKVVVVVVVAGAEVEVEVSTDGSSGVGDVGVSSERSCINRLGRGCCFSFSFLSEACRLCKK